MGSTLDRSERSEDREKSWYNGGTAVDGGTPLAAPKAPNGARGDGGRDERSSLRECLMAGGCWRSRKPPICRGVSPGDAGIKELAGVSAVCGWPAGNVHELAQSLSGPFVKKELGSNVLPRTLRAKSTRSDEPPCSRCAGAVAVRSVESKPARKSGTGGIIHGADAGGPGHGPLKPAAAGKLVTSTLGALGPSLGVVLPSPGNVGGNVGPSSGPGCCKPGEAAVLAEESALN
mmetsp:Transcript_5231/g.12894  ORF Transcript_5231/g.12894 Transcript_5231/m.12894 type:complete len:232 (+) Transcript_5231:722-1417(+)